MGRAATVGSVAGKYVATITAANYDSGSILSTVFAAGNVVSGITSSSPGELAPGSKSVTFQLVPGGMSAGSITVFGTLDNATAQGLAQLWEPIPAPNTAASDSFSWYNPLTATAGQHLLYCNAPFAAFRVLASGDYADNGTHAKLIVFAGP